PNEGSGHEDATALAQPMPIEEAGFENPKNGHQGTKPNEATVWMPVRPSHSGTAVDRSHQCSADQNEAPSHSAEPSNALRPHLLPHNAHSNRRLRRRRPARV